MSKIKRFIEQMHERTEELKAILERAKAKRPELFAATIEAPTPTSVKSLLRGITDDETLILLVTIYLGTNKNPE